MRYSRFRRKKNDDVPAFLPGNGAAVHVGAPFMTPGWRRCGCGDVAWVSAVGGGVPRCGGVAGDTSGAPTFAGGGGRHAAMCVGDARLAALRLAAVCAGICGGGWRRFRYGGVLLRRLLAVWRATQVSPLRLADVVAVMWAAVALRHGDMKRTPEAPFGASGVLVLCCAGVR